MKKYYQREVKINQQLEQQKKDREELIGTTIGLGVTYFLIGI